MSGEAWLRLAFAGGIVWRRYRLAARDNNAVLKGLYWLIG